MTRRETAHGAAAIRTTSLVALALLSACGAPAAIARPSAEILANHGIADLAPIESATVATWAPPPHQDEPWDPPVGTADDLVALTREVFALGLPDSRGTIVRTVRILTDPTHLRPTPLEVQMYDDV